MMPLSEHEQKLLSQMEQQLLADDPRFASAMRGSHGVAQGGKRLVIAAVALVVGLVCIVFAVAQQLPVLAVPGFLLMLAGVYYGISRPKLPAAPGPSSGKSSSTGRPTPPAASGRDSLINRLEQRWDRRRDDQQR